MINIISNLFFNALDNKYNILLGDSGQVLKFTSSVFNVGMNR